MASYFDVDTPDIVLKSLFAKYDKDNSGFLGQDELKVLAQEDLGLTAEEAETFALLIDKDGNQKVSFEEFKEMLRGRDVISKIEDNSRYHILRKAVELFKEYDKDGSGAIGRSEADALFRSLGTKPEHTDSAMKALDKNADGTLSFPEFLDWLNWLPKE